MQRLTLTPKLTADLAGATEGHFGAVYFVQHNVNGFGTVLTPIARYFMSLVSLPAEGFHEHWRIDCFVRDHELSPPPAEIGEELARVLLEHGLCSQPLWLGLHRYSEVGGKAFGEVFDLDG